MGASCLGQIQIRVERLKNPITQSLLGSRVQSPAPPQCRPLVPSDFKGQVQLDRPPILADGDVHGSPEATLFAGVKALSLCHTKNRPQLRGKTAVVQRSADAEAGSSITSARCDLYPVGATSGLLRRRTEEFKGENMPHACSSNCRESLWYTCLGTSDCDLFPGEADIVVNFDGLGALSGTARRCLSYHTSLEWDRPNAFYQGGNVLRLGPLADWRPGFPVCFSPRHYRCAGGAFWVEPEGVFMPEQDLQSCG